MVGSAAITEGLNPVPDCSAMYKLLEFPKAWLLPLKYRSNGKNWVSLGAQTVKNPPAMQNTHI